LYLCGINNNYRFRKCKKEIQALGYIFNNRKEFEDEDTAALNMNLGTIRQGVFHKKNKDILLPLFFFCEIY
jgi:hypothetical protein